VQASRGGVPERDLFVFDGSEWGWSRAEYPDDATRQVTAVDEAGAFPVVDADGDGFARVVERVPWGAPGQCAVPIAQTIEEVIASVAALDAHSEVRLNAVLLTVLVDDDRRAAVVSKVFPRHEATLSRTRTPERVTEPPTGPVGISIGRVRPDPGRE